jgi:hypothetical protein
VEACLLTLPHCDAALTSPASSRCIALRPRCRSAAISAWSRRLLLELNTNPELLLLLPPASPPGSFLTVLPEAADSCVRALVQAANAAPPAQRADVVRVRNLPVHLFCCRMAQPWRFRMHVYRFTASTLIPLPQLVRHTLFAQVEAAAVLHISYYSLLLPACGTGIAHDGASSFGRTERPHFHSCSWPAATVPAE